MPKQINQLNSLNELCSKLFELHGSLYPTEKDGIIAFIGAGVSVSAGVPATPTLLKECYQALGIKAAKGKYTFERVLTKVKGNTINSKTAKKIRFGDTLVRSGIPRFEDLTIPNKSNLLITQLLYSNFFRSVISLNVDPLMQISTLIASHNEEEIRFIRNISQFSAYMVNGSSIDKQHKYVFQPHGTIQEPESLRFEKDELFNNEFGINAALIRSAIGYRGVFCVGASLSDGVFCEFIKGIANQTATELEMFTVVISFYNEEAKDEGVNKLQELIKSNKNIRVFYIVGGDSDEIIEKISDEFERLQRSPKLSSNSLIPNVTYIPLEKDTILLRQIVLSELSGGKGEFKSVKADLLIALEVVICCLAAREPFFVSSLIKTLHSALYISLVERNGGLGREASLRIALTKLIDYSVLSICTKEGLSGDMSQSESNVLLSLSAEDGLSLPAERFIKLNDAMKEPGSLAKSFLEAIGVGIKSNILDLVVTNLLSIERNRERKIDLPNTIALSAFSDHSEVIKSSRELDENLRPLKDRFQRMVEDGEGVHALIVSEGADHFFSEKIEEENLSRTKRLSKAVRQRILKAWVNTLFEAKADQDVHLKVIIAKNNFEWMTTDSSRAKRNAQIRIALKLLNDTKEVEIKELSWEDHTDHMWLLESVSEEASNQCVYFPRRPGEIMQTAIVVKEVESMNQLKKRFKLLWDNSDDYID
jgi:hypothetical protein